MKRTNVAWIVVFALAMLVGACGPGGPDPNLDVSLPSDTAGDAGTPDADTGMMDTSVGEVGLCDPEPAAFPPRPLWSEIVDGSGVPDYQNVMDNVNVLDSLRLLASLLSKAVGGIDKLRNDADTDAKGHCLCNCVDELPAIWSNIDWSAMPKNPSKLKDWANNQNIDMCYNKELTRDQCITKCDNLGSPPFSEPALGTDLNRLWIPNNVFKATDMGAKFTLVIIDWLDELTGFLSAGGSCMSDSQCDGEGAKCINGTCKSKLRQILDSMSSVGAELTDAVQQVIDSLEQISELVNRFTEGYHLGGYSMQRPDLHMCVGYAGHGAYAQMGNLGGDKVSIGARYTSHQLSHEHRAQFRSGGFGVSAFGKSLSLLPSVEANMQIHGFKLWDASKPFGIQMPMGGIDVAQLEKYGAFHLVEPSDVTELAGQDGEISLGDLFVDNFYVGNYTSGQDGNQYVWPRSEAQAPKPWLPWKGWSGEDQSMAVFSAGLNLPLAIKPLELDLPSIPVFPPYATLQPYFKLSAGVEWIHEDFRLRSRIQEKVNENIPANLQLSEEDFERDMHALQAPDVTEDLGTTAYVQPEAGAILNAGIQLADFLQLGIGINLGVGARVEPGGWGGVVDMNYALVKTLMNSNPPPDADCNAVYEVSSDEVCGNASMPRSQETFQCSDDAVSSCCISYGDKSICIEDWTGITKEVCEFPNYVNEDDEDAKEKIKAWIEKLDLFLAEETRKALMKWYLKQAKKVPLSGTWNQDQTCVEAECGGYGIEIVGLGHLSTCEKHGYCVDGDDNVLAHDVTQAECEQLGMGDGAKTGRCCSDFVDRPETFQGFATVECDVTASTCEERNGRFVPDGVCVGDVDRLSCENSNDDRVSSSSDERTWVQYQCITDETPEVVGWEGPGCHPLNQGFPSACSCQEDGDCASGESCNDDGVCEGPEGYACTCDPNGDAACGMGRTCQEGGCFKQCSADSECASGMVCDSGLCQPDHDIATAEEIIWGMANGEAPMHAVSTYALSDVLFWSYVTFGIDIGLTIEFFFGTKELNLFDWNKVWDLASQYKTWYQPGLEARYQSQCTDPSAQVVTNRWPEAITQESGIDLNTQGLFSGYVNRYPDPHPQTPLDPEQDGNACNPTGDTNSCSWDDLVSWCKPHIQKDANVMDPEAPSNDDLGDSFGDTVEWGEEIGLQLWESQQVCIDGQLWHEWAQNQNGSFDANTQCRYENPDTGQVQVFACTEVMDVLLEEWGCLSTGLGAFGPHLKAKFGSSITKNGLQTFDIDAMKLDPSQPLTIDNLKPLIRFNPNGIPFAGQHWLADVEQCFDLHQAQEAKCECSTDSDCYENAGQSCNADGFCETDPGQLASCPVVTLADEPEVGLCCGDGTVQGEEECDDGNTEGGDGCSSYCTKEGGGSEETGSCCMNGMCVDDTTESKCEANGGTFNLGGMCSADSCQGSTTLGACCVSGSCIGDKVSKQECDAQNGTFSPGKNCSEVSCGGSSTMGACCINGTCHDQMSKTKCAANNGTFSAGKNCSQVQCKPAATACCAPTGLCVPNKDAAYCKSIKGTYYSSSSCSQVNCTP